MASHDILVRGRWVHLKIFEDFLFSGKVRSAKDTFCVTILGFRVFSWWTEKVHNMKNDKVACTMGCSKKYDMAIKPNNADKDIVLESYTLSMQISSSNA